MNDGHIHSTGEASAYCPMSSGCSPTGDGIVIDNAGYPGGAPTVSITGGKVLSDNAKAVASYAPENSEVISKFINGGEFSSDVTELCVPCFTASENGTGMYEVAFDPEAVNEALEELENKLAEQQEFLDALDDTFASDEELSQKLEEAKEAIQAAQQAVDQAQNTAMTENVANLQTAINNALAAMSEADEQVLATAKAYTDSEIASIKDQVDANKAALDVLDETYATDSAVSSAIEEAKSQIEQAQEAIDNAQNTALSQNVQALTNAINEAKQAAADADASTLSAAKSYADSIAEGLQTQINAQKDILDSLDDEYAKDADVASAIAQAKDAIETAQSAIDAAQNSALTDKVQELTQAINDARQAAQTANESTLTAAKGYADTLASGLQNQIDAHQLFLDNLNDTYAKDDDVASAIQTAKESIESAQASKDALQDASLDNLADAITEAKEAASSANADTLAAAKAYTNEVKDALQGQITDNKNALDSLDDEYAKDADVASAIADAKQSIENAQALINELNNTQMNQLAQAVQDAKDAVSGSNEETLAAAKAYTDAKAAQLQSQIDDLQDKLDKLAEETATNNINNVNVSIAAKAKNYNTVVVSWNTSKITVDGNKVSYKLMSKKSTEKDWKQIYQMTADGSGKSVSYTVKSLATGTTYNYKVVPSVSVNGKVYTGSESLTRSVKPSLAKAKLIKVKRGKKKATLKFKKVVGANGYQIYYKDTKAKKAKKKLVKASSKSTISKTVKKLKKGRTYTFKVRAYRTVNGKKVYGAWSNIKKVKIKK